MRLERSQRSWFRSWRLAARTKAVGRPQPELQRGKVGRAQPRVASQPGAPRVTPGRPRPVQVRRTGSRVLPPRAAAALRARAVAAARRAQAEVFRAVAVAALRGRRRAAATRVAAPAE